jgi:hypothetical protein
MPDNKELPNNPRRNTFFSGTKPAILILNFFATDLHGLSQIFTEDYLLFCFIVNLLNPSVLIRVFPCSSAAKIRIAVIYPKSTIKKNDEGDHGGGDHGGSPLQDFVGAGPRACPDTPEPIVSIHAVRIGKF